MGLIVSFDVKATIDSSDYLVYAPEVRHGDPLGVPRVASWSGERV